MNTGIQRSSATPRGAWTTTCPPGTKQTGKSEPKKDLPAIVAAHGVGYVATASPGYPTDLMNKVRRAAATPGPSFIHILAPCPTGWRMATGDIIKVAKTAVESRAFPLYEVIEGRYMLSKLGAGKKPIDRYLKIQGRFKHLPPSKIEKIQLEVDQKYAELKWLATKPGCAA